MPARCYIDRLRNTKTDGLEGVLKPLWHQAQPSPSLPRRAKLLRNFRALARHGDGACAK